LELKEQILAGSIPEPDRVYVALGTMGTAVGLMLGLNAAGLKTRVTAVRIAESGLLTVKRAIRLLHRSNSLLWSLDSSFPNCTCTEADIEIRDEFMGLGYARFTEQGMDAVRQMKELEGIELEGTYTGKTLAALIDDARKGAIGSETILFWNTSNARKLSALIASVDYHQLPRPLHRYFEVEVQPLDRSFGRVSAV
jgi:1-aminocyclopropane-1-carboxylate deaminase/D-cysteine desulfhydrase-like pyridoxal-dependent ACC family enzyme